MAKQACISFQYIRLHWKTALDLDRYWNSGLKICTSYVVFAVSLCWAKLCLWEANFIFGFQYPDKLALQLCQTIKILNIFMLMKEKINIPVLVRHKFEPHFNALKGTHGTFIGSRYMYIAGEFVLLCLYIASHLASNLRDFTP